MSHASRERASERATSVTCSGRGGRRTLRDSRSFRARTNPPGWSARLTPRPRIQVLVRLGAHVVVDVISVVADANRISCSGRKREREKEKGGFWSAPKTRELYMACPRAQGRRGRLCVPSPTRWWVESRPGDCVSCCLSTMMPM